MGNGFPGQCELQACSNPQVCSGEGCGKNCTEGECAPSCLLPGPIVQRSTARVAEVEGGAFPRTPYISSMKYMDSEAGADDGPELWREGSCQPADDRDGLPYAADLQQQQEEQQDGWCENIGDLQASGLSEEAGNAEMEPEEDAGPPAKQFVLKFPDGSCYSGEIKGGVAHGIGKLSLVDGSCYEGQWLHGEKCGKGREVWPDGTEYEGDFLEGSRCGKGIYRSRTGMVYTGMFKNDKMQGEGICNFSDGRTYVGQWYQGHIDGQGRMTWSNGSEYEGCYVQDLKHGEGAFTWPDGRQYRGQWVQGKQDGAGEAVDISGVVSRGNWVAGRLKSVSSPPHAR